jgi:hypothetical protein
VAEKKRDEDNSSQKKKKKRIHPPYRQHYFQLPSDPTGYPPTDTPTPHNSKQTLGYFATLLPGSYFLSITRSLSLAFFLASFFFKVPAPHYGMSS